MKPNVHCPLWNLMSIAHYESLNDILYITQYHDDGVCGMSPYVCVCKRERESISQAVEIWIMSLFSFCECDVILWQETMSLRTMWAAVSGQHQVPVLVGSLLVYFLAFVICLLLQRSFKLLLPRGLYTFAADFCFTMVVCSYPYSHGTVRHLHGAVGYVIAAVTLVTLSGLFFEGTPSPLGVFRRYLKGAESTFSLAVRIVIQILAAFLSYQLVYFVWSLEACTNILRILQGFNGLWRSLKVGGKWYSNFQCLKSLLKRINIILTDLWKFLNYYFCQTEKPILISLTLRTAIFDKGIILWLSDCIEL